MLKLAFLSQQIKYKFVVANVAILTAQMLDQVCFAKFCQKPQKSFIVQEPGMLTPPCPAENQAALPRKAFIWISPHETWNKYVHYVYYVFSKLRNSGFPLFKAFKVSYSGHTPPLGAATEYAE